MSVRPKDKSDFDDALDEIANWATRNELYTLLAGVIKEHVKQEHLSEFIEDVQRRYT